MPIKESVTIDEAIAVLNRALEKDPAAISELFLRNRSQCNDLLADDETIQVGHIFGETECTVGVLGILNGIFGIHDETGYGAIEADVRSQNEIVSFKKVDHSKIRDETVSIRRRHDKH
jgi:hypothetical protein